MATNRDLHELAVAHLTHRRCLAESGQGILKAFFGCGLRGVAKRNPLEPISPCGARRTSEFRFFPQLKRIDRRYMEFLTPKEFDLCFQVFRLVLDCPSFTSDQWLSVGRVD